MVFMSWYLVKNDMFSAYVNSSVHWTSNFLQGTRTTRPCLSGYPVPECHLVLVVPGPERDGRMDGQSAHLSEQLYNNGHVLQVTL